MSNKILDIFNIKLNYYLITNENNVTIKMITAGGTEVIREANNLKDIDTMLDSMSDKEVLSYMDGMRLPFKYTNTPFDINKLEELLKYKSIKSLSKEKALEINNNIKSKSELEDKIVYAVDKEPSTNSLAIAKQFDLKHFQVVEKLFELGSMYPSVLMKIKHDVYTDKPLNHGTEDGIEYSAPSKKSENFYPFYHVPEDVYYQFVKKIGTPKGLSTPKGLEKLIFIESKQDEYFNAFQSIREFLHDSNTSPKEIGAIIKSRTKNTKILMANIYDYVTKYNSHKENKKINLIDANKLIFNIVNYTNNINAINYIPPTEEELKSNKTRKTKDEILQEELTFFEGGIASTLSLASKHNLSLLDVLTSSTKLSEDDIYTILNNYNSTNLLSTLKG